MPPNNHDSTILYAPEICSRIDLLRYPNYNVKIHQHNTAADLSHGRGIHFFGSILFARLNASGQQLPVSMIILR